MNDAQGYYRAPTDPRNMATGLTIGAFGYSDQAFVQQTDDGTWLCLLTAGHAFEGAPGQTVVSMRSFDDGKTWHDIRQLEPTDGVESSYGVMLKAGGRIYAFYNHNTDNVRSVPADKGGVFPDGICRRVDSLGYFVFRYTDDGGLTWSENRYPIPVRAFEIDKNNASNGDIRYFWNVGKPFFIGSTAYVSLHKVGGFGEGFFTSSEGVLLACENILTETDAQKLVWQTLPDGEIGIRAPEGAGPIGEEQSYVVLSDDTIYCIFRTVAGHPACSRSFDGGHTFTPSRFLRYGNERVVKHPRAANFVWKCSNGRFLYWYHNHGGCGYDDRNPVWLCAGVEIDTPEGKDIAWSQGEIALYHPDYLCVRMSYPDLIEKDGEYYITETQKSIARLHRLDKTMLERMWASVAGQLLPTVDGGVPVSAGDVLELKPIVTRDQRAPDHRSMDTGNGFTLAFHVDALTPGKVLFSTYTTEEKGLETHVNDEKQIEFRMGDGRTVCSWASDVGALDEKGGHVVIIVDGGPRTICFVVNGVLCDGGETRQFGFGRYNPYFHSAYSPKGVAIDAAVSNLTYYPRALKTFEAEQRWLEGNA